MKRNKKFDKLITDLADCIFEQVQDKGDLYNEEVSFTMDGQEWSFLVTCGGEWETRYTGVEFNGAHESYLAFSPEGLSIEPLEAPVHINTYDLEGAVAKLYREW